jgi:hypothetical protein
MRTGLCKGPDRAARKAAGDKAGLDRIAACLFDVSMAACDAPGGEWVATLEYPDRPERPVDLHTTGWLRPTRRGVCTAATSDGQQESAADREDLRNLAGRGDDDGKHRNKCAQHRNPAGQHNHRRPSAGRISAGKGKLMFIDCGQVAEALAEIEGFEHRHARFDAACRTVLPDRIYQISWTRRRATFLHPSGPARLPAMPCFS